MPGKWEHEAGQGEGGDLAAKQKSGNWFQEYFYILDLKSNAHTSLGPNKFSRRKNKLSVSESGHVDQHNAEEF